ncbi:hypothetical protein JKA74_09715 [Marivirga sp. S37H4]|uniref:Peptidase M50 domain-containing protein n=1 Tax=Marivirga aurantiaca TaxID=2802615 RepID=A0A935C919_9BACT|nr:site-2 protease family protein [Marivirga aurantiaca]MBK6265317.1 hypothetical protein [Marivirga aurantiaca]
MKDVMSITSHTQILEQIQLTKIDSKNHILKYHSRHYNIGEILYKIIFHLQSHKPLRDILDTIYHEHEVRIEEEELEKIISDTFEKVDAPKEKDTNSYIYGRVKLIGKDLIKKITPFFTFLFKKSIFLTLFTLFSLTSLYFIYYLYSQGLMESYFSIGDYPAYLIVYYVLIIVIGMLHEFGHAIAARRHNIDSEEIGFGFYLVFPVLFTNLTAIWSLPKKTRALINMGGIYIQLFVNVILIIIFFLMPKSIELVVLVKSVFIINNVMLMISINPFFRNDGYWIYSDLFGINNLSEKASKYPMVLFNRLKAGKIFNFFSLKEIPLALYSLLTYLLFAVLITALCLLTYKNYFLVKDFFTNPKPESSFELISSIAKALFSLALNAMFLFVTTKRIGRLVKRSFIWV